jgi:hypothetical protein
MTSKLNKNRINRNNNNNTFKYLINCKDNQEDTSDWLEIISKLETKESDYKIFTGLLENKKEIVAKIGSDKLKEEYIISKNLDSLDIPTFLKTYCFFQCLDDIKNLNEKTRTICKKDGNTKINVIIMPYYKLGELYEYKWKKENFKLLQNLLKHIILSLFYAHKSVGFIHKDLHLGNVLIHKTTRKEIYYGEFGSLECIGYIPIIMDYDRSIIDKDNYKLVYYDMKRYITLISVETNLQLNTRNLQNLLTNLYNGNTPSIKVIHRILEEIDTIKIDFDLSDKPPTPDFSKGFS